MNATVWQADKGGIQPTHKLVLQILDQPRGFIQVGQRKLTSLNTLNKFIANPENPSYVNQSECCLTVNVNPFSIRFKQEDTIVTPDIHC